MSDRTSTRASDTRSTSTRRPRRIGILAALTGVLAVGLSFAGVGAPRQAEAATVTFTQCDDVFNADAAELNCDVTITNSFDTTTGITSSIVETTVCTGAPGSVTCVNTPAVSSSDIIDRVEQCNDSANAGGSTVTCNVIVVNNIIGDGSTSPATVNQCIGSGAEGIQPTLNCDPMSSTTNADITQCNGSVNGGGQGGPDLERVNCTVHPSTTSSLWPVDVFQCNGTANGGGALMTCTTRITNNIVPAQAPTTTPVTTTPTTTPVTTTPAPGAPTTIAPATTLPVPTTVSEWLPATGNASTGIAIAAFVALLFGLGAVVATRRRPGTS